MGQRKITFISFLSGIIALVVGSSTHGEKAKHVPVSKTAKPLVESSATQSSSAKPVPTPPPFAEGWGQTCQPNEDNCLPEKKENLSKKPPKGLKRK